MANLARCTHTPTSTPVVITPTRIARGIDGWTVTCHQHGHIGVSITFRRALRCKQRHLTKEHPA